MVNFNVKSKRFQEAFYMMIKQEIEKHFGEYKRASCFFWTSLAFQRLSQVLNERVIIQAGSASFPVFEDTEDKTKDTHLSYVWERDSKRTEQQILLGRLPELHCWLVLPESEVLIDLTSGLQKEQCKSVLGLEAERELPKFIWNTLEELRVMRFDYTPDKDAIILILSYLEKVNAPFRVCLDEAGELKTKIGLENNN